MPIVKTSELYWTSWTWKELNNSQMDIMDFLSSLPHSSAVAAKIVPTWHGERVIIYYPRSEHGKATEAAL